LRIEYFRDLAASFDRNCVDAEYNAIETDSGHIIVFYSDVVSTIPIPLPYIQFDTIFHNINPVFKVPM
jgi:hypothetical protein